MAKVNFLLSERLKMASEKLSKMTNLAEMSTSGNLSSFSGVFKVGQLPAEEVEKIRLLLTQYEKEEGHKKADLEDLIALTSEVKAISNQAAILHGERIKKAQTILKKYRDGAFTAWLIHTYGNRQTPYNFLQYYELTQSLPSMLIPKLDAIPRQALYTLASREGDLALKEEIINNYSGQTKDELLDIIRKKFPLASGDGRAQDFAAHTISALSKLTSILKETPFIVSKQQKKKINALLKEIASITGQAYDRGQ
jgi:hypothetical protein